MLNRSLLISFFLVTGCQSTPSGITSVGGKTVDVVSDAASGGPLAVLSIAGGLCLLAGMVLLVITRGQKGWYPSIGGVLLCLLNYMVLKYDDLIFYPLVILTGMISAAWTYRVVTQILTEKKSK